MPDLVPAKQVGLASGLMGLMLTLGTIVGVGIATLGGLIDNILLATMALGVVEVATMVILVATVDEGPAGPPRTRPWRQIAMSAWGRDILAQRDVLWLLLVRLLFLGAYNATLIAIGYFRRSHGMSDADADATVFAGNRHRGGLHGAGRHPRRAPLGPVRTAPGHLGGGRRSPRIGLLGVALAPNPAFAVASWVPFGIGMGIFLSADWALMADVIPKETSGPLHGHPQRRHGDGRTGLHHRRRPGAGPRGRRRQRSGRAAGRDGHGGAASSRSRRWRSRASTHDGASWRAPWKPYARTVARPTTARTRPAHRAARAERRGHAALSVHVGLDAGGGAAPLRHPGRRASSSWPAAALPASSPTTTTAGIRCS